MKEASAETRNATAATSVALGRPSAVNDAVVTAIGFSSRSAGFLSASIGPGWTVLTVSPRAPSSCATDLAKSGAEVRRGLADGDERPAPRRR